MPRRSGDPVLTSTGRRIIRVCSEGKRGWQEIADALGADAGSIQHSLTALLRSGALHSDAPLDPDEDAKPRRGDLFWADEEQLAAAERAGREARDNGLVLDGDLVLLVRGPDVAALAGAMRPGLTATAIRWAVRLVGSDALWLLAVGPDRDMLVVDQLISAVRQAGGTVETFAADKPLDGTSLRSYLAAAANPPAPARK